MRAGHKSVAIFEVQRGLRHKMSIESKNDGELLLIHDLVPNVVNLYRYLSRCLGSNFATIDRGTVARPLYKAELSTLVRERVGHRVYLTFGASPIGPDGT